MMKILRIASLALGATIAIGCASRVPGDAKEPETAASIAKEVERLAEKSDSLGIARKLDTACKDVLTRSQCLETQLTPLASNGKVKVAMGALAQLAASDPGVRSEGHVFAHGIGIAAGKTTNDIAAAFTQCNESFQSGCYHGIIQAWFGKQETVGVTEVNGVCQPFRGTEADRWIRFQCVHGMGHGLTMLYKHDLRAGLQGCDLLSDGWDKDACYGGAFMENIVNVSNPHHPAAALVSESKGGGASHATKPDSTDEHAGHDMGGADHASSALAFKAVDKADPHYPCSMLDARYQRACYGMQTSVMLYINGGSLEEAARSCNTAPRTMRTVCFSSLGRDISSYSQQNHAEAVRMCSMGEKLYQPWCYYGVVKNIIDLNARPADGLAFCRSTPGDSNKQVCYAAAGEQILVLMPDVEDRKKACSVSELAFLSACLYGARVNTELPTALGSVYSSVQQ